MAQYTRIFLVQEKLSDYVRKVRHSKGWSREEVSVKSGYKKGEGEGISPSYIGKIENNVDVNPTTPYLKALAKGLEISEQKLIDIARGMSGETPLYKQFAELFEKIPAHRQRDLLTFAELFAAESNSDVFHPNYDSDDEETFKPNYSNSEYRNKKAS